MSNSIGTGFSPTATGRSGFTTGGIIMGIPGVNVPILVDGIHPVRGGGIPGLMPQANVDGYRDNSVSQTRFTLRDAWNTQRYVNQQGTLQRRVITPFRAVNNAGDYLSRDNYSCGGACQTFQSRPGLNGLRTHFGAIHSLCDGSNVPPAACNVKYVYDSSDYITYLKQKAVNQNYNDLSDGGNNYSGAQSALRAIRRY